MEKALELGDWAGLSRAARGSAQRAASAAASASPTTWTPRRGVPRERGEVTVHPDGRVDFVVGIVSNGQGHETSFAQLVNEWLGVPIDERAHHRRRHRHREDRRRHARRPGPAHGEHRHLERVKQIIEKGKRLAALHARVRAERDRRSRTAASSSSKRTKRAARSSLFEVAAAGARLAGPARGPARAARRRSPTRPSTPRPFPTAATSAKSRSIPSSARWRSCATPRWTTWAARSIR